MLDPHITDREILSIAQEVVMLVKQRTTNVTAARNIFAAAEAAFVGGVNDAAQSCPEVS